MSETYCRIVFILSERYRKYKFTIFVYADRDRIQKVISNLLNNAYKFTENGQIIVKIKKKIDNENKQVKISVKDSGTGIERDTTKSI